LLFVIRYSLFVDCSLVTGHWSLVTGHWSLIAVKKNQPKLYKQLEEIAQITVPLQEYIYTETSHGRQVNRQVSVFTVPKTIQKIWQGSQYFIKVERKGKRKQKPLTSQF